MIFDDTYEHEVWNDTGKRRVVLFLDFARPLRFPLSAWNSLILKLFAISPYVQRGRRNMEKVTKGLQKDG